MAARAPVLGIDFGTSNSGAAYMRDGKPCLVEMAPGQNTLPTTFFFDFDTRQTLIGEPANQALLNGDDGRFMRALKRVLGTSLMHQKRQILNQQVTFVDIIARFLKQIRTRAEAQAGVPFNYAVSGRPVVFHGTDDPREDQAEADLKACYLAAGFKDVTFLPEPQAAAIAGGALDQQGQIGLIVDIGGGTSDFSVFRSSATGLDILANHGIRIGGTDFDRAINIDRVMPLLGKGTELRKVLGAGTSPVPNAIFNDLATWEKIPFLYTAQNRRSVDEMERLSVEPRKIGRLSTVLEDELGHELAFAVERGKIAANSDERSATIQLGLVERGLSVPLSHSMLDALLSPSAQALTSAAEDCVRIAGITEPQVDQVIYVGGSSMMAMVSDAMRARFPNADHSFTEVFTAVTNGLALSTN